MNKIKLFLKLALFLSVPVILFLNIASADISFSPSDLWSTGTESAGAVVDSDGDFECTGDIAIGDDVVINDDLTVGGDLAVTGSVTSATDTVRYTMTAGTLTDGTASMTGGALSDLSNVTTDSTTVTYALTAGTLTDGTASMASGALSGLSNVTTDSTTVTYTATVGTLTDGTASMTSGALSGLSNVTSDSTTVTYAATVGTLTDGTLSITGGNISSAGNIAGDEVIVTTVSATGANGLWLVDDGNNGIFIADGGNIGIGLTNMTARLELYNGSIKTNQEVVCSSITAYNSNGLWLTDNINNGIFIEGGGNVGISNAAPAGLFEVGGGTFTVLSTGLVGINDETPTSTLDVVGGGIRPYSRTEAELRLLAPAQAGEVYFDSTNNAIVISTGTSAGQFGIIYDGSTLCTGW